MSISSSLVKHAVPMIFMFFGMIAFCCYASPAYADIPIAQVVWVKGTITATSPDKKERTLKRSDFVYEHDTIKTDSNSSGQLVFTDSSLMSLREGTEFKVDEYKYSKEGPPSDNKFLGDLVKGGFRTVTGAISKDHPENYQVNTPVATIGVRGTQYVIYLNPKGELEAAIERGAIFIKNAAGSTDLSLDSGKLFSTVRSKTSAPKTSATPPPGLKAQPALQSAKPSKELNKAAGIATTTDNNNSSGTAAGSDSSGGSSGGNSSTGSGGGKSSGGTGSSGGGGGGGGCGNLNIGG